MDELTRDELRALLHPPSGTCLSLFMPAHRAGPEKQQGPIRLENLLREAAQQLLESGLDSAAAHELLAPIQPLIADWLFWQHQSDGLAIFIAPGFFRFYRLPLTFAEMVVVNKQFYIRPLLPLLPGDGQIYILALSKNGVRLWQATRYRASEIALQDVPANLAETLKYDDFEKQTQFHTGVPGRGGERGIIFHGQGARSDVEKEEILRYFQHINRGVHAALRNDHAPLVLAGVDYLLPLYREVNTYPYLMDNGVVGNPNHLSSAELHQRAWEIARPILQRSQAEATDRYRRYANTRPHLVSSDLREIIPAACHGRVDTLFLTTDHSQWGSYDAATSVVLLHERPRSGDIDLMDLAAYQTLLNNGSVYAVASEQMPGIMPLSAIFRY